jgi:tetratricopeptide (TPR) repeat protein
MWNRQGPAVAKARSIVEDIAAMIRRSEGIGLSDYLRAGALFNDAFELMNRGNWLGALKGFRASAALNERSAPTHGNTGLCFAYLGRKAEALAELDRALDIDPEYLPAASNRRLVEQMVEGLPIENTTYKSINFARENLAEKPVKKSEPLFEGIGKLAVVDLHLIFDRCGKLRCFSGPDLP